jgi:hypothetical protein
MTMAERLVRLDATIARGRDLLRRMRLVRRRQRSVTLGDLAAQLLHLLARRPLEPRRCPEAAPAPPLPREFARAARCGLLRLPPPARGERVARLREWEVRTASA